jgi:hypothetical protein
MNIISEVQVVAMSTTLPIVRQCIESSVKMTILHSCFISFQKIGFIVFTYVEVFIQNLTILGLG